MEVSSILPIFRTHFPNINDPEAALFTAAIYRVALFNDPGLTGGINKKVVFAGTEYDVTDPGILFLEAASYSALFKKSLDDVIKKEPTTILARTLKEYLFGIYAVLYPNELENQSTNWAMAIVSTLNVPPLSTIRDLEISAFEEAKGLYKELTLAKINISAVIETLQSIARGEIIAAKSKYALGLIDKDKVYTVNDFAPEDHEHEEYLPEDGIAANAKYLVENGRYYTSADFATDNHEHTEYAVASNITNADYLITNTGELLSSEDLAPAGHYHAEYLLKSEPAFAAKYFTDGQKIYKPEDFAQRMHTHNYLKKTDIAENTRLLQGYPLSYFALANHTHEQYVDLNTAKNIFRDINEPADLIDEAQGFIVKWF